ncbi:MAG: GAF domain-containing protein [Pseudomonadota bacterium]
MKRPVRYLPYVEVELPPRGRISFMNLDLSELRSALKGGEGDRADLRPPPGAAPGDYRTGWVRESVAALGRHAKDLEAFIEGLLQLTTAAIPSRMAWLLLSTPDGRELGVSGAAGEGARHFLGRRIAGDKDLASVCVQGGISIRISDLQKSRHPVSLMPNQRASLERSVLCAPLIHDHYVLGAIQLLGSVRDASFTREDLDLLENLCKSAAMLLRRFELSVDHSLP